MTLASRLWRFLSPWDYGIYPLTYYCPVNVNIVPLHIKCSNFQFSLVQSFSRVQLFATPWIAARQASLSTTNSQSSLKLLSIESVMPSSHLILCCPFSSCPQSLPASESFPMSQLFAWGGQSTGVSPSASVLLMNTQDWSPSEWTGWISLQSKGLRWENPYQSCRLVRGLIKPQTTSHTDHLRH